MKKIYVLYFSFLILVLAGCNTGNKLVKKTYAFTSIRMPGTLPVDDNGRPIYKGPDTSTLIFVETVRDGIVWEHAWNGKKSFLVNPILVKNIPLELGHNKSTGENVILTPQQGNQLWQLLLTPTENLALQEALKDGEVLLEGRYKDKKFTRKISSLIELSGPDAQ